MCMLDMYYYRIIPVIDYSLSVAIFIHLTPPLSSFFPLLSPLPHTIPSPYPLLSLLVFTALFIPTTPLTLSPSDQ